MSPLYWKQIGMVSSHSCNQNAKLNELLDRYSAVLAVGLGHMNTFNTKLHLKPNSQPKFVKARTVPFALKPAVERELERIEEGALLRR